VVINASDGDAATGELQIDGEWKPALVIGPEETPALTNNGRRLPAPGPKRDGVGEGGMKNPGLVGPGFEMGRGSGSAA